MVEKLKSRKFWLTLIVAFLMLFAKSLDIPLDEATVWQLVTLITGYNVTQGYVDAKAKGVL